MLTRLLNYIYNNCKQLLSFRGERKEILKITTTWSKETGRIALITIFDFSDFSGKILTSWDSISRAITQTNVVGLFCDAGYSYH